MNLQGANYSKQKGFCEDFDDGKLSYPVVKCCQKSEAAKHIIFGIFQQMRISNMEMMHESRLQILDVMSSVEALRETYDCLQQLQKEAEQAIQEIEFLTRESNLELLLLVKALGVVPNLVKKGRSTT